MQIKAAVAREPQKPFVVEPVELAEPGDDQILVKIVAAGMCHTDIAARDMALPVPMPIVLGHEGAGIVEKVGKTSPRLRQAIMWF